MPSPSDLTTESKLYRNFEYLKDYDLRMRLIRNPVNGFRWFCIIYLHHYFKKQPALFHGELTAELADHMQLMLEVVGFRGSAKSTFASMALILWAALVHPDKYPFILPISDTSTQSKMNMSNIKTELDGNWLLKNDFGTFRIPVRFDDNPEPDLESDEDWQAQNVLLECGVRILSRSRGQKVRGLRHREHRPKLIVVDDAEDREWVKTKENRDKTDQWLRGEVIPARDIATGRIILIGNWLHEDAIMARMKKTGLFKVLEYALYRGDKVMWRALYPDQKTIDKERVLMGEIAYQREMLLRIVPEDGQVITPNDIHYYDVMPQGEPDLTGHGVDLAISKEASADYTADVAGEMHYDPYQQQSFVYIKKNPLNAKLNFLETIRHLVSSDFPRGTHTFFVEGVQYQMAAIEELTRQGLSVTAMKPIRDKRSRLIVAAPYIKTGIVKFPRTGAEDLLAALFGFGVESHDDLVDALVWLVIGLVQSGLGFPQIASVDLNADKKMDE